MFFTDVDRLLEVFHLADSIVAGIAGGLTRVSDLVSYDISPVMLDGSCRIVLA